MSITISENMIHSSSNITIPGKYMYVTTLAMLMNMTGIRIRARNILVEIPAIISLKYLSSL